MIPVPEELADRVVAYVSWKRSPHDTGNAGAASPPQQPATEGAEEAGDDGGPVAQTFASLDDSGRKLLAIIAAASLEQDLRSVPDAAARAGMGAREAVGATTEVNKLIADRGGPPIAIAVVVRESVRSAGFNWENHAFLMRESVAQEIAKLAGVASAER